MNQIDLEARLVFKNDSTRHSFMLKAVDQEDFVYRLAGDDSVVLSKANAEKFETLAKKFGGVSTPVEKPVHAEIDQIPDREERINSWNALEKEIQSLKVA